MPLVQHQVAKCTLLFHTCFLRHVSSLNSAFTVAAYKVALAPGKCALRVERGIHRVAHRFRTFPPKVSVSKLAAVLPEGSVPRYRAQRGARMPVDRENHNWQRQNSLMLRMLGLMDRMRRGDLRMNSFREAYNEAVEQLRSQDRMLLVVGRMNRNHNFMEDNGNEVPLAGEELDRPLPVVSNGGERAAPAADSALPAQETLFSQEIRQATGEEEAWLEEQDRQTQEEERWLANQAENYAQRAAEQTHPADADMDGDGSIVDREAEEFDGREALENWTRAQQEAMAMAEAETCSAIEEARERELLELASVENVERHHMMRVLQKGAHFLLKDEIDDGVSYEELVSIHYSAQRLAEQVERGMHVVRERERQTMLLERAEALRQQAACQTAALAERLALQAELSRLREDQHTLRVELEQERERTICRICFSRPRDALPLPCMHFDFCNQCLEQQQQRRNICPTCRGTINGILKYTLSLS